MGDRCYLHITMAGADIQRFGTFVGFGAGDCWWNDDLDEPVQGVKTVGVLEANWGWIDPLQEAAKQGLIFVGGHDAGCGYGAHAFVGVDGIYHEVPVSYSGDFAVDIDSRLRVNPESLAGVRRYIDMRARARAVLGIEEPLSDRLNPDGKKQ